MLIVTVWGVPRLGIQALKCVFVVLRSRMVFLIQQKNSLRVASRLHIDVYHVQHTFVGRPQEEGMMSVATSFPSVCETKVIEPVGVESVLEGVNCA